MKNQSALERSGLCWPLKETFEKCSNLFKSKPPAHRVCAPEGKAKILTTPLRSAGPAGQTDIHYVFRGFKFEPDAGIGQKRTFFKGFNINFF